MIKKFINYYKPYKKLFFLDIFVALIAAVCDLVYPYMTKELINITSGMMGKIYPKTIIDTILNVRVKEGLINNDKDYNNTKNSIIDTFIYHENKKMNKYSHYIFFDDNKLLKDICMIDDNFEFTYNQIYNRNKTI